MCSKSAKSKDVEKKKNITKSKEIALYVLGVILIGGFFLLYWTRFACMPVLPPLIRELFYEWGKEWVIIVNATVFVVFVLFLPYRTKVEWRSKGLFSAFILALMAEMFGIPLLLYILSPIFGSYLPMIQLPGQPPVTIAGPFFFLVWPGVIIGTYMTLIGMILVFAGWVQIHKTQELVTIGLYRYVRHPQYTGIILVMTGWILHWATLITVLMYPILLVMYYRLARREEKELLEQYGNEYALYLQATPMFFPTGRKKPVNAE